METINTETRVDKKYPLIYIDAPWEDKAWPMERVRGIPVEKWVEADALLLLWVPSQMLPQTLLLLTTWGFEYAGLISWRKPSYYLEGYWWRSHCEYLLVGKKGTAKTDALLRHTLYEGAYNTEEFKPQGFRSLLSDSGYLAFGAITPQLDLFGAYWHNRYASYEKGHWDFVEES